MDDRHRWERDAERVRKAAPEWLDMERVPWWLWAVMGAAWAVRGVYVLLDGGRGIGDRAAAVGLLLLIAPSQLLLARRRKRGEPLYSQRHRR